MRIVQKKQIGGGVYPSYYYNNLVATGSKARKKDTSNQEESKPSKEPTVEETDARFPRVNEKPNITTVNGIKRVHSIGSGEGYINGTEYESLTNLKTGETAEATITIDPRTGKRVWTFNPGQEEIYNRLGNLYYGK